MSTPYEDIINLPHPVSAKHPRMSVSDRAAQFSPFAALTGYDAAIKETARLTGRKPELDEDAKTALDRKLHLAAEARADRPEITVTYFRSDSLKEGGFCESLSGRLKKIDVYERRLILEDGSRIDIDDILNISGDMFNQLRY